MRGRRVRGRSALGRTALGRVHRLAAIAWSVLATAAGLGFVARDLVGLPGLPVALAWAAGALLAVALSSARPGARD